MVQLPQISTLLTLRMIRDYGAESDYHMSREPLGTVSKPFVFEIIAKESGRAPKQAWRKIETMNKKGYVAYGSSARIPWLTSRGKAYLTYLENLKSDEPVIDTAFTYEEKSWSWKKGPAVLTISDSKLEACTNCGKIPKLVRTSWNPLSKKRQFKCVCGVSGPVVHWSSDDPASETRREAVVLWNSVMHGAKRYGRKNEALKTHVVSDT